MKSMIIGIGGGTGSGKTTAARMVAKIIGEDKTVIVAFDDYYRDQPGSSLETRKRTNYDHPDALEAPLLARHLEQLKAGRAIERPVYDFVTHSRKKETVRVESQPVIVVEGILALYYPELLVLYDSSVFVDEPSDIRFIRRLRRDVSERGRTMYGVIGQYLRTVRPMHEAFVEPTKARAKFVIGGEMSEGELREIVGKIRLK